MTFKELAAKAARMVFPGYGGQVGTSYGNGWGWGWRDTPPGAPTDYAQLAGDLWHNEIVSICLRWIGDNYTQADFEVVKKDGNTWEPVTEHPLTSLMRRPNPWYSASSLWQAVATSEAVSGNAYLIKGRPEPGWDAPVELWYVPHWQVFPQWDMEGRHYITHYIYRIPGKPDARLEVEDVVHFRKGLNLYNVRSGEAPLGALLREICTDNEAVAYTTAILANAGIYNVAISADGPNVIIPEDEAQRLSTQFQVRHGGDNRGRVLVCTRAMKIQPMQWSPEDMALDTLRMPAEARVTAAFGLNGQVLGLNVGEKTKTYVNYAEARRAAWEEGLIPQQMRHAETLERSLLPDFPNSETLRCRYNYDNVPAMAEDENEQSARAKEQYSAGIITRREARQMVGKDGDEEDEVFFLPSSGSLVPAEHAGAKMLTEQAEQKQEQQQAALQGMQSAVGAQAESSGDMQAQQQGAPNGNGRSTTVGPQSGHPTQRAR